MSSLRPRQQFPVSFPLLNLDEKKHLDSTSSQVNSNYWKMEMEKGGRGIQVDKQRGHKVQPPYSRDHNW